MGLPNSPSTMTKLISMVVSDLKGVISYIRDILVTSEDLDTCNRNLKDFGLKISPEKCQFSKSEVL